MIILRTKLDKALRKQEEELKGVLADYLQLITKLLTDKEELTNILETMEGQLKHSKAQTQLLEQEMQDSEEKDRRNSLQQQELTFIIEKLKE